MSLNRLEVLTKQEIQEIHSSTIELLGTVGVIVESPEAREILKKHGATIELVNNDYFVKFPEELITE